jgi:DDE superfamily endonuclease
MNLLALLDEFDQELLHLQALFHLICFCYGCYLFYPHQREPSFFEQRIRWQQYADKHTRRGTFAIRLRMERASFDKLLSYLRHEILVNELMAKPRGGMIIPKVCLFCTLRWLAGGSYLDITDIVGISKPSFYRVVNKTVRAIVNCDELDIIFPKTAVDIKAAAAGFASRSYSGAIKNCVGVADGYLLRIKVPRKKEVGNVRSYFSGHYQCYGLNIQAVADHHSRFIYYAVAAPGVTADRDAIKQCTLDELVEGLPLGYCIIGDNAYEPTERMVPVFGGQQRLNEANDNFNFYASQLRIRVEMAFGIKQIKWGLLQRPVQSKLKNVRWIAQAIARLHNFVINERLLRKQPEEVHSNGSGGPRYLPSQPHDENGDAICLDPVDVGCRGFSELRERMVVRVKALGLKRPASNKIIRKRRRDDE